MILNEARIDAQIALYQAELKNAEASAHALSGAIQGCQALKAKLDEPEPADAPPSAPTAVVAPPEATPAQVSAPDGVAMP